jgi:hypothetical protein
MKQIATALVKAQKAFGPALKSSTNPHFKSRYADLANCVEAVVGALNDNGVALIQTLSESDSGVIVETMFLHESGEVLNCGKLHIPATKHDAQGFGSALTYARRYSLMAACGIAPEDDDGNAAVKKVTPNINTQDIEKNIQAMQRCETEEALISAYKIAHQSCNGDKTWLDKVVKAKDELKLKFRGE